MCVCARMCRYASTLKDHLQFWYQGLISDSVVVKATNHPFSESCNNIIIIYMCSFGGKLISCEL